MGSPFFLRPPALQVHKAPQRNMLSRFGIPCSHEPGSLAGKLAPSAKLSDSSRKPGNMLVLREEIGNAHCSKWNTMAILLAWPRRLAFSCDIEGIDSPAEDRRPWPFREDGGNKALQSQFKSAVPTRHHCHLCPPKRLTCAHINQDWGLIHGYVRSRFLKTHQSVNTLASFPWKLVGLRHGLCLLATAWSSWQHMQMLWEVGSIGIQLPECADCIAPKAT